MKLAPLALAALCLAACREAAPAAAAPAGPQTEATLVSDAKARLKARDLRGAQEKLEACIQAFPASAHCHKLLGGVYSTQGDSAKGAQHYQRFVELAASDDPDLPKVKGILSQLAR
ncbi:MAG: hypothetical protein K1X89_29365 [Myxococcaceae bacterium]|nr:hypothetical protein [Myxococcaceae bacterium]